MNMQTNNLFSFERFLMLWKQSLIINKRMILISLTGIAGLLFFAMMFFQFTTHFRNWDDAGYCGLFLTWFITVGVIYISNSFPAFRAKERTMAYLMLPATSAEKFFFELLSRILLFILLMPLLIVTVFYLETFVIHHFVLTFDQFTISKLQIGNEHFKVNNGGTANQENLIIWTKYIGLQYGLFLLITIFTGASHFSKSPLLKTFATVTIIYIGFGIYTYLITKGFDLNGGNFKYLIMLIGKDSKSATIFAAIMITVLNLSLLAFSFFRLKEKEV